MKKGQVLLRVILSATFVPGIGLGAQSGYVRDQIDATHDEKPVDKSSPEISRGAPALTQKEQTDKSSNKTQKRFVASEKENLKRQPVASSKPALNHQFHSAKTFAAKDLQAQVLQNIPDSHPISRISSSDIPGKAVRNSSNPILSSTVALNGQQFKNPRNPGGRMASSGGSANLTRGTAVINGSGMKRKP
jgi:hypothetical protein